MSGDDRTKPQGPVNELDTVVARPRHDQQRTRTSTLGDERYKIGERLGAGGMGEVLAARDEVLGREIAIKRMLDTHPTEEQVTRFLREARIQGTLDHPAIPPVHELAYDTDGRPYFVMKKLVGVTLSEILGGLARGDAATAARYPQERLLRAFAEVCLAIEFAHTRSVIHRDLKPANIMLGDFGEVFVLDWGVAKALGAADEELLAPGGTPEPAATHVGEQIGTPAYMAPEQRRAGDIDGRADVFALGCMFHEILSGRRRGTKDAPLRPIPPELDALCAHATAEDIGQRLSTARALGEGVQGYLDGDRDLAMRRALAAEHLSRARAALGADDESRLAMLEAGRALALDPTLPGAAELVGRLMLAPPRAMPPEVRVSIAAEQAQETREQSRAGVLAYAFYLAFIPLVVWGGMQSISHIVVLGGTSFLLLGITAYNVRSPIPTTGFQLRTVVVIVGNAVILCALSRMFSPFLVAPGMASMAMTVLISSPAYRRRSLIAFAFLTFMLAILGVYAAELLGWIAPTIVFDPHLHIVPTAMTPTDPRAMEIGLCAFAFFFLVAATVITLRRTRVQEAAQRQIHMLTWRLAQLVPSLS